MPTYVSADIPETKKVRNGTELLLDEKVFFFKFFFLTDHHHIWNLLMQLLQALWGPNGFT